LTPAARLAAAASILDSIAQGRQPAEVVLKAWGTANRYAGSKDRRAIADRVYKVLRARGRLSWIMGGREDGRALVIGSLHALDNLSLEEIEALHTGDGYGPRPLSKQERSRITAADGELPGWVSAGIPEFVMEDFQKVYGDNWKNEAHELMSPRAPIDLRVNSLKTTREEVEGELRAAELSPEYTPWSELGLRLAAEPPPNIQALEGFKTGAFEIQDEGSQIICALVDAKPGTTVVDYCAGGGGKTLGLAQSMQGQGRLVASDVVNKRLENIRPRLERAGVEAELVLIGQNGGGLEDLNDAADLVLVDAPCSGTGTWRRHPEDAWRLTGEEVERLHALQTRIMSQAAKLVKQGGRIAYVTCSMLSRENEDTAAAFEAAHPNFKPVTLTEDMHAVASVAKGHQLRLSPASTNTDGFFFALYERVS